MNLELKEFQETAVARLYRLARHASAAVADEHAAIVLSAPTGSGKTMIATALLERIAAGDEETLGDPNAVFLWLTDQPELNEQTRKKFEANSNVFSGALIPLDLSFAQPRLEPGNVYFLNTQKIGRATQFVRKSDKRQHTIWEIVARAIAEVPASFWLVIDEAHRGMDVTRHEREEAQTIVQKFILGSEEDGLPPLPLILGISATPQRFDQLLAGTERTRRSVEIKPDDVRESGLLKDLVTVSHPMEAQPSDITLLSAAAAELERFRKSWAEYAEEEKTRRVEPLLVVQIEDARKGSKEISRTPVPEVLTAIERVLGPLAEEEVAHCLQEGHALTVAERTIPYVAPSDIEEETTLRVVLFKSSLNTGWDCPRAEVMMSFRRAVDLTHIAQLVGRMVRTPLARRVSTIELLSSVSLYLPHYNEEALGQVVSRLSSPDPDVGISTEVRLREDTLELSLDPKLAQAVKVANSLPTYSIERIAKTTNVKRLLRLGRELAYDDLDKTAPDRFRKALLAVLKGEREARKGTKAFGEALAGAATLDIRRATFMYGEADGDIVVEEEELEVAAENIDDLHSQAGRLLGEGLHAAYAKARLTERTKSKRPTLAQAKQELYTLLQIGGVRDALEGEAGKLLGPAFAKHDAAIRKLPDERRQRYRRLRKQARAPEAYMIELPTAILGQPIGKAWKKHLYVGKGKTYHADLNTWETAVLKDALSEKGVVGWLRNPPRKEWSLCVPYRGPGGDDRGLYPDFLIFRKQGADIVCDIIDPHSTALADAWSKAASLADYATRHDDSFGRIKLIAKVGNKLKELDLKDEDVRAEVRAVDSTAALLKVFKKA